MDRISYQILLLSVENSPEERLFYFWPGNVFIFFKFFVSTKIFPMKYFLYSLLILTILGCSTQDPADPPAVTDEAITEAFPEISFTRPVDLQHAGDGTDRIFVVEQRGVISVFPNDPSVSATTT